MPNYTRILISRAEQRIAMHRVEDNHNNLRPRNRSFTYSAICSLSENGVNLKEKKLIEINHSNLCNHKSNSSFFYSYIATV